MKATHLQAWTLRIDSNKNAIWMPILWHSWVQSKNRRGLKWYLLNKCFFAWSIQSIPYKKHYALTIVAIMCIPFLFQRIPKVNVIPEKKKKKNANEESHSSYLAVKFDSSFRADLSSKGGIHLRWGVVLTVNYGPFSTSSICLHLSLSLCTCFKHFSFSWVTN